ncbi:MAG: hypothetical protein ABIP51_08300 [Bacteroidia bacterium]
MADLWGDGLKDLYLYELTKSNKVIKHKVRNLVEFDNCVIIAIGDNKDKSNHKLIFSQGSGTKRTLGDSMFYTDFAAIKSKFNSKFGLTELKEEIKQLEIEAKQANDVLTTRKFKLERLLVGMQNPDLIELDEKDKAEKDAITDHLKKTIYHYASRYGTDLTFTFLIDRIFTHTDHSIQITKEDFAKDFENSTIEELQLLLNKAVKIKPSIKEL